MATALTAHLAAQLEATNYRVARVNKLLSSTSNLDVALLTVGYTLHLVHALLDRLQTSRVELATSYLLGRKSKADAIPPPVVLRHFLSSRLTRSEKAIEALASVIDDYRMSLRLKGLPVIWSWGVATYHNPPPDNILKAIAWTQVLGNAAYQYLENGAYLATKGVLAFSPEKVNKWFIWSSRFWCLHVALEFARLLRTRILRRRAGLVSGGEEKEGKLAKVKEEAKWWEDVYVNAAWLPLTVHWSTNGFVGEGTIALLSLFAGSYSLRQAWRDTA